MLVTENNLAVKMQVNNVWNEFPIKLKEVKTSRKNKHNLQYYSHDMTQSTWYYSSHIVAWIMVGRLMALQRR